MVSQVAESPEIVDQEVVTEETETPAAVEVAEGAAPAETPAAAEQVQVTEPDKPDYITRADWEQQLTVEREQAAADALETERRRRQTEGARQAKAQERAREEQQEAADVIRASLVAKGYSPEAVDDDTVVRTIDRVATKKAERMQTAALDTVDEAWDYLTAPAYNRKVDLDDSFETAAKRLGPKVQHLIDTIRPAIEVAARKGYIAETDLPKRVEAEIARRNAKGREGQENITRVEGSPSTTDRSHQPTIDRVARGLGDEQDVKYAAEYVDRIRRK